MANGKVSDGPFITHSNDELMIKWLCNSQEKSNKIYKPSFPYIFSKCGLNATVYESKLSTEATYLSGNFDIAVFSDVHGQFSLMKQLLLKHNIIDKNNHWRFGKGHLVIPGDIFDRGAYVTESLWFLYQLQHQAQLAGGDLHLLLGNHEVMIFNDDYRYLHPKYINVSKQLKTSTADLYAEDTILGNWLRNKNVVIKINNHIYTHGGLHPDLIRKKLSLAEINQVFSNRLLSTHKDSFSEIETYLHGANGPVWYRGYFSDIDTAKLDLLLHYYQAEKVIVGHTSHQSIISNNAHRIIGVDSSIKHGKSGELLLIRSNGYWRGLLSGKQKPLFH
ncbi:metallophosphoesterase [Pseudoalteromonas sp. C2R02]|uniref:metallophosphoesterase n=1 Tax=Pseudoalteromonas sp. C2R02 TaxID=2841565 RepID=UPI001C08DF97|nr:metallophosphoesterase [Pseudoalteromonas sp. C2R02]MBU2967789.1 metallophosphoesterase [Pseudoalteromonas sp. C2R02]